MADPKTKTPDRRHGVRRPLKCPIVAEEVVETDVLRSEHAVIQAPGGLLEVTGSKATGSANAEQIEAAWRKALARTAALAKSCRSSALRPARRVPMPRSRTPRPAAPPRRGSRRSADKDDDPDDGDHEAQLCWGCDLPLIGYRKQARFHGERCRSQYRRDKARDELAESVQAIPPRRPSTCLCRADIALLSDDLGPRCTSCAKRRLVLVAPTKRLAAAPELERAVAA